MKYFKFILLFFGHVAFCQTTVSNLEYFDDFIESHEKSVLLVGENHSSSVGSKIYPELIKELNKKHGTRDLLIEFGPSEAYFYTQYLETGDEKYLGYTIYAGYYKDWKKAWRKIYAYNQQLSEPLILTGIDFDRARTMAYAFYNIFKQYNEKPTFIDSLMEVVKTQEFYKTYTNGYPTDLDIKFTKEVKTLLTKNINTLQSWLSQEDFHVIRQVLDNIAIGYGNNREKDITENAIKVINASSSSTFLMLIGRDHAYKNAIYDDNDRFARLLKEEGTFSTLTGLILHENSQQWNADYDKSITLYEIRDKVPWKYYNEDINAKVVSNITIIPLKDNLKELSSYTDYIITAFNQGPIEF